MSTETHIGFQQPVKGKAKAFTRTYGFLAAILPYTNAEWEKLSIFLNFLTPKLPAPEEQDLSKGILEAIDMDSYRVEAQATMAIALPDADAEIGPVPLGGVDLYRDCAAPLTTYRVTKENGHGQTSACGVPRRSRTRRSACSRASRSNTRSKTPAPKMPGSDQRL